MSAILALIATQADADPGFHGSKAASRGGGAVRRWQRLSDILVLTDSKEPAAAILPSLRLLPHAIRVAPAAAVSVSRWPAADAVLVDARNDLVRVRQVFRQLRGRDVAMPVLAILTEGGWAAVTAEWGADDLVLHTAGPGEVEARLRLPVGRMGGRAPVRAWR